MFIKQIISTLIFATFPIYCFAQLPQDARHAGGIAVIPLSSTTTQVFYEKKPILIAQEGTQRYAIFGIPLSTPLGTLSLTTNALPIQIEILPYQYAEQHLNVKNQD